MHTQLTQNRKRNADHKQITSETQTGYKLVLKEKTDIHLKRILYLKAMKKYRDEGRPIVFTDESYAHSSHTKGKAWLDTAQGLKRPISKGQRIVMVHAGSETGFVPNALLMFKSGSKAGDYHDMNYINYEKWLRTQLIPNLNPNSVVVIDNAPYHNKLMNLAPTSTDKKAKMESWFYELYRIPGVVGCIDCTHVAIHSPPNDQHYEESIYVNRKGYHSINTQLICDANLCIINVNALFPGPSHDSFIWNQSKVSEIMEQLHRHGTGTYYLIGDSGYPLRPWLHNPIPEPQPGPEENYNKAFKSARSTIERCNGVLKSRFPSQGQKKERSLLKDRVLLYLPEKATQIINSCCVLHNMCINSNINIEDDLSLEEDESEIDFGIFDTIPQQEHRNALLTAGISKIYRNNIVRNYF
ncbi:unnamed protein product [Euphydryas editha]|uniref:DDE Tnp4 domain-containing protein n=1 Tax=Euphydryas editha TaxID=104508 RepID=A0AAU9VBR4_EUPED|nr:unnamed protein product [Euphydryas editha]